MKRIKSTKLDWSAIDHPRARFFESTPVDTSDLLRCVDPKCSALLRVDFRLGDGTRWRGWVRSAKKVEVFFEILPTDEYGKKRDGRFPLGPGGFTCWSCSKRGSWNFKRVPYVE